MRLLLIAVHYNCNGTQNHFLSDNMLIIGSMETSVLQCKSKEAPKSASHLLLYFKQRTIRGIIAFWDCLRGRF